MTPEEREDFYDREVAPTLMLAPARADTQSSRHRARGRYRGLDIPLRD